MSFGERENRRWLLDTKKLTCFYLFTGLLLGRAVKKRKMKYNTQHKMTQYSCESYFGWFLSYQSSKLVVSGYGEWKL